MARVTIVGIVKILKIGWSASKLLNREEHSSTIYGSRVENEIFLEMVDNLSITIRLGL